MSDGPVIMIVDDEKIIRESLVESLKRKKCETICAEGGHEAFKILEERHKKYGKPNIQLILCDWMMPNGDGIEFLQKLRASEFHYVPFILMSGAVTPEELKGAAKYEPDGILVKPFNADTLFAKIMEAVERREQKEILRQMQR